MPVFEDRLRASIAELRRRREGGDADPIGLLHAVVDSIDRLTQLSGAALMLVDEHHDLRCVVATSELAGRLEAEQVAVGEGPCLDAFSSDAAITSSDLHHDRRWPRLVARLDGAIRAFMAVPVRMGRAPVGSLNVFSSENVGWAERHGDALLAHRRIVEQVLHQLAAREDTGELGRSLDDALDSRVVVERAVGYLMARRGLDAGEALQLLRRASRDAGRQIAEVAEDVLSRGDLPGS